MKIEKMGVVITDVPGIVRITVEQDSIVISMEDAVTRYNIGQVAQLRNALDAVLAEHAKLDTAMTTPNTFHVGQVLAGTEDLPVGATVRDGEGNTWYHIRDGRYSMYKDRPNPEVTLAQIVENHARARIESLP